MRLALAATFCLAWTTVVGADESAKTNGKRSPNRIEIEGLITADKLPAEYGYTLSETKGEDDALLGRRLVFTKEDAVSKVSVSIENRKLPDRNYKKTALKGYVNGRVHMFQDAGLKLVKKKLPDIDKVNVAKRTTCDLVFENADRAEIDVQIQVFFTDVGHLIVVVADNKDDYKALAKWAKSIQAVDQHDQRDAKVSEDGGDSPSKAE